MLFSDERSHALSVPKTNKNGTPYTIADLIDHLCRDVMKDTRQELFVLDNSL